MVLTSSTGLIPAAGRNIKKRKKEPVPRLDFQSCIQPVSFVLKPLTGIYKPYKYGCSVLCNHPGDSGLKEIIQRTKLQKGQETDEEIELAERLGQCLEEMLERYSTAKVPTHDSLFDQRTLDSRTASGSFDTAKARKCFTPQPNPKKCIVLDLRRTHSQDTITTNIVTQFIYCSSLGGIGGRIQSVTSPTESSVYGTTRPSTSMRHLHNIPQFHSDIEYEDKVEGRKDRRVEEDEEVPRRRGRLRRKKKKTGRDTAEGGREVMGIVEPGETQVSAYAEGVDTSGAGSPEPGVMPPRKRSSATERQLESSVFDPEMLKHLRRYASSEDAECEFRKVWRRVLTEALKASDIRPEEKMILDIQPCCPEDWLSLPRTFSRDAARFELPLDRMMLEQMTPLEYLRDYVSVKNNRKLLYNHIFNKYIEEEQSERIINGHVLPKALGEVMGRELTDEEEHLLHDNIDWQGADRIDLRTWSGICGFTERLLGKLFTSQPDQDMGNRPTIEELDFNLLPKWLATISPNPHLKILLNSVSSS
ncbi:hypothetical protein AAG570_010101 [Ranatra chinensis]|uniref:Uncharacterized protein n=1 Tax=Ranatra chinensis TaxID=642074 RepID=A0ABD0YLQ7_9HEMI